jgi:ABC-2 type transport system ATP-binding protein
MIEVERLHKRFGATTAVDDLSFTVRPGHVTGFLGPNGAGKTTTMRIVLGLQTPSAGTTSIGGRAYRQIIRPLRQVGALLDANAVHRARSAYHHLLAIAQSNHIGRRRITEVLQLTGLDAVAHRRGGGFSLGMRQRLGIATAWLGDPPVLIFDEPVNGLDTDGILWVRELFKILAGEGRTVLVSSHLMSEIAQTADHLIIIGRGRLLADTPTSTFVQANARADVLVRSPAPRNSPSLSTPRVGSSPTRPTEHSRSPHRPARGGGAAARAVERPDRQVHPDRRGPTGCRLPPPQRTAHPRSVHVGPHRVARRSTGRGGPARHPAGHMNPLYLRLLVTTQPLTTQYADRDVDSVLAAVTNGR